MKNKTKVVSTRLTGGEYGYIWMQADEKDLTVSELIYSLLFPELKPNEVRTTLEKGGNLPDIESYKKQVSELIVALKEAEVKIKQKEATAKEYADYKTKCLANGANWDKKEKEYQKQVSELDELKKKVKDIAQHYEDYLMISIHKDLYESQPAIPKIKNLLGETRQLARDLK